MGAMDTRGHNRGIIRRRHTIREVTIQDVIIEEEFEDATFNPNLIERAGELPRWWVGIVFRACFGGALEEADIRKLQYGLHN